MTARASELAGMQRQRGAALVVGLMLLMVLTVLAISGMNTSTVELQMAGNMQYAQTAFHTAETGIEVAMLEDPPNDLETGSSTPATHMPGSTTDSYESETTFDKCNGATPLPGNSFGEDGGGQSMLHFDVESVGRSARDARVSNEQSYFVEGPAVTADCEPEAVAPPSP
jgi:type IV pilus assembly protein PilX